MTRRNRPVELTDAPEHRSIPLDRVEIRAEDEDTEYVLSGYASTFEEYEMYGGPANYGWIERIDPGAFDKTLREKPDLHLLINHAGMPLARTKSGTLSLSVDDHGLKVEARLDKRDPEVQSLAVKMARGDMDEMSFAFRVKAQEWRAAPGYEETDNQSYRTITEVSLHKGDVSVVNWGANSSTTAEILSASDLLRAFVECDDVSEARSEEDLLKLAKAKIDSLAKPAEERDETPEEGEINLESTIAAVAGLLEALREMLIGETEERDDDDTEVDEDAAEAVEEAVDESLPEATEGAPATTGRSLTEALAEQGVLPEERLNLAAAMALL